MNSDGKWAALSRWLRAGWPGGSVGRDELVIELIRETQEEPETAEGVVTGILQVACELGWVRQVGETYEVNRDSAGVRRFLGEP